MESEPAALPLRRVGAALVAISLLAFGLPFAIVQSLHARRLAAADGALRELSAEVPGAVQAQGASIPAATHILSGRGLLPAAIDDTWTTAPAYPLARLARDPGPDPWGNAYLLNIGDRGRVWAISAGPDGILQTPFTATPDRASGDDIVAGSRQR